MSSGTIRSFAGSFRGTGSAQDILQPGFRPRFICLTNVSDPAVVIHIDGMDAATGLSQEDGATALVATQAITIKDAGFSVGTDAQCNASGDLIRFYCSE